MNNLNAKAWIFPATANALTLKIFTPAKLSVIPYGGGAFFMGKSAHVYPSLTMSDQTAVNLLLDPIWG